MKRPKSFVFNRLLTHSSVLASRLLNQGLGMAARRNILIQLLVLQISLLGVNLLLAQAPDIALGSSAISNPRASADPSLAQPLTSRPVSPEKGDQTPAALGSNPGPSAKSATTPPKKDVKSLVEDFKKNREQTLKQSELMRKQLAEKLATASQEERTRLIAEYREKLKNWLHDQKALSEEFRQRATSIRDEFKNRERDQLLDEVKSKTQELRDRVGKD